LRAKFALKKPKLKRNLVWRKQGDGSYSWRGNDWTSTITVLTIFLMFEGHICLHTHIPVPICTSRCWNRQAFPSSHLWCVLFYNEDNTVLGWFSETVYIKLIFCNSSYQEKTEIQAGLPFLCRSNIFFFGSKPQLCCL